MPSLWMGGILTEDFMKKLLVVLSLAAVGAASHAAVIYDTFTPAVAYSFYTGPGNTLSGDNFNLPSAGAGMHWRITQIRGAAFASAAGTYSSRVLNISFWNGVGASANATDPAFSNQAGTSVNAAFGGTFNATAAGSGFTYSVSGLSIDLANTPVVPANGYGIRLGWSSSGPGTLSSGYKDTASSVAGSAWSNGFFIDTNASGVLQNNEFVNFSNWTNGNLAVEITAIAVPEPATLAILGVGALAMLRRRKKA